MGRVWRLDTESGAFAVKESLWPDDPDSLRTQLELSACVCDQAHDAGVRVPRVRRTEGGSLLLSVYGSPGGELTPVRVATWIEGKPCDRTLAGRDAAEWLGSTLATLECLPDPPTPPTQPWLGSWFTHAPDTNEWQSLVRRGEREHAAWAPALAHQLTALVELGQLVGSAEDGLTVTHTDLQPANVLVTDDGYALLDWDDVGSVSRNRTLARAINDWHLHGAEIDVDGIRRTVTAYRAGGGMGIVREPRDFGDVIAGFLNYLRGQADVSSRPVAWPRRRARRVQPRRRDARASAEFERGPPTARRGPQPMTTLGHRLGRVDGGVELATELHRAQPPSREARASGRRR